MAEEEARERSKRSERRDPARNARRDPPLIEGQAQDITPTDEANTATSLPPEPAAEPAVDVHDSHHAPSATDVPAAEASSSTGDPDVGGTAGDMPRGHDAIPPGNVEAAPLPRDTRSHWGTLAALSFVVLAAGLIYLFTQLSNLPPDNSAAVADLKSRLATLESRPASDDTGLADRMSKLEGTVVAIQGRLDGLDKRIAGLAGAASSQPDVSGKVADMQAAITELKTGLAAVTSSIAALPRIDLGPVQAHLGELDQKLSGLQGTVSSIPHIDLGPLTGKVDGIENRLKPIEAQTSAAQSPEQVAQRRAAPVAVTAQAIMGAIDAGQAFPKELQALRALGADPDRLAPLQAVAERGAPSLPDLQATLLDMRDRIVTQGASPARGSYVDRLMAGASSLVQVRPLGSVVGDTPAAIVARMHDEIGNDALPAAIADWHKLPEASQSASSALVDRIKLRLDAEQAAKDIAANAIGTMALPRG